MRGPFPKVVAISYEVYGVTWDPSVRQVVVVVAMS